MSEPMYITLARACQASDASQNEKILAGIVLQQHAEIERMRPVVEGAREWAANNGEAFSTAGLLKIVDEYETKP